MMQTALALLLLALSAQPQNLLINGSMEYWHVSGLTPQGFGAWTPVELRSTWRVMCDRQVMRDGRASMRVAVDDWVNVFAGARVEPGETYTYSAYVHCDQPVKVGMRLSVGGENVDADEREKNRKQPEHALAPGRWQRISVTDTMPPGAKRVTAYLFLRGVGTYHLDMVMLNRGALVDYLPGPHFHPIAPLARVCLPGEVRYMPQVWNGAGEAMDDPEAAYAFDADVLSSYRLRLLPGSVGAMFEQPVRLRGLALLCGDDAGHAVQIRRDGVWADIDVEAKPVGPVMLLSFEPATVEAIRICFVSSRKVLRIYHVGFAQ